MNKVEHLIAPDPSRKDEVNEDTVTIRHLSDRLVALSNICANMEYGFTSKALFLDQQRQWKTASAELAQAAMAMKTRAMRSGR